MLAALRAWIPLSFVLKIHWTFLPCVYACGEKNTTISQTGISLELKDLALVFGTQRICATGINCLSVSSLGSLQGSVQNLMTP